MALHTLCGIDACVLILPPPKLTSMRGVNLASTPSSPSFRHWYKCGSRTRDTRFIKPLLYPSELTCGGVKQSGRAVRACATLKGRKRARWAHEPTVAARSMFQPRHKTRQSAVSNPPSRSRHRFLAAQNDETPVGSAFRGLRRDLLRGLPMVSPANSRELGLTHQDFQGARGCAVPCADFQRRALPRAKNC
jgi:hypothetical protein